MTCRECGFMHHTRADVHACEAMHGRPRGFPDGGPMLVCTLCGDAGDMAFMMEHFHTVHRWEPGRPQLIRFVHDVRDVSRYEGTEP